MADSVNETYGSGEVAALIGVSASTLRVYSVVFASLLSPAARQRQPAPGRAFRHRRYSLEDVAVLQQAKRWLAAGLSYSAALEQLAGPAQTVRPPVQHPRPSRRRPGAAIPESRAASDSSLSSQGSASLSAGTEARSRQGDPFADLATQLAAIRAALAEDRQQVGQLRHRLDQIEAALGRIEARLGRLRDLSETERQHGWLSRLVRGE